MRDIKFRVWDNLKKEWISNKSIWRMKIDDVAGQIQPPPIYWKQHPEGLTYQQFTGTKDKNGNDIYEGDILRKIGYCPLMYIPIINRTFSVEWSEFRNGWNFCNTSDTEIEVIGNVFENPDLIKQEE